MQRCETLWQHLLGVGVLFERCEITWVVCFVTKSDHKRFQKKKKKSDHKQTISLQDHTPDSSYEGQI
jgi:hypothetical protein